MSVVIDASAPVPALARTRVRHQRTSPFRYGFAHRSTSWLVDADSPTVAFPPVLRRLLTIRPEDHLGSGRGTLGDKLRQHLRQEGLTWTAGRVLVLTNARTFGHVFDPLTTYFCFDGDGKLEGVLAEVHNTYGESHCYPLPVTPESGRASTDKEFYVSPFFAVEGRYDITARLDADRVAVAITLSQDDGSGTGRRVFSGHVVGDLVPATRRRVWRAFLRDPFASQRVSGLIRWHGVRLWLRRLPVVPRPTGPPPDPPVQPTEHDNAHRTLHHSKEGLA
jgi:hypothetical protein